MTKIHILYFCSNKYVINDKIVLSLHRLVNSYIISIRMKLFFLYMKRVVLLLIVFFSFTICFAQIDKIEKSAPSYDTEIVRRCAILCIEGKYYSDVVITMKSVSPDYLFTDCYKVKVTVKDKKGKKIYKKDFIRSYLYIFNNGQIQIGKPKFNQIVIKRDNDYWYGEINEKEGIY